MDAIRQNIMEEAHASRYSIHSGANKKYRDIRDIYWWNGMKKDVDKLVSRFLNFQQVKVNHQGPGGLTQDIDIPTGKWEDINKILISPHGSGKMLTWTSW